MRRKEEVESRGGYAGADMHVSTAVFALVRTYRTLRSTAVLLLLQRSRSARLSLSHSCGTLHTVVCYFDPHIFYFTIYMTPVIVTYCVLQLSFPSTTTTTPSYFTKSGRTRVPSLPTRHLEELRSTVCLLHHILHSTHTHLHFSRFA